MSGCLKKSCYIKVDVVQESLEVMRVYLIHYTRFENRLHNAILTWNRFLGIEPTIIRVCDRENLIDTSKMQNIAGWNERLQLIRPILIANTLRIYNEYEYMHAVIRLRNWEYAKELPTWLQTRGLKQSEISVLLKHQIALALTAYGEDEHALIAEDDCVITEESNLKLFKDELYDLLNAERVDYIDIAGGVNLKGGILTNYKFFNKLLALRTRTTACYVISRGLARKIINFFFPLVYPIDWHLQFIMMHPELNDSVGYWSVESPIGHGSEIGAFQSWQKNHCS
jgi:hypothetical protein